MTPADQIPPYSEKAEQAAIGCMLMEPERVIPLAMNQMQLAADCFYVPIHEEIVAAIFEIYSDRGAVDQLILEEWFKTENKKSAVDAGLVLSSCVDEALTTAHAQHYLDIVRQTYIRRRTIEEARNTEREAHNQEDGEELIKTVPGKFLSIIRDVVHVEENIDVMTRLCDRWRIAKDGGEKAVGLPLPWPLLNELLCGLEPGLTILAARPSVGKTTIEDELSCYLASTGVPVGRVTLDSSREQLFSRSIARKARVSLPKMKFGFARESQLQKANDAKDVLAKYPMHINDTDRDWQAIATWARMMKKRHGIKLLTLDYIQLVNTPELKQQQFNQVARVTHVSTSCKQLAAELGIPVLVLSQLSRGVEKDNREPRLSDLRDSGAIEQDAEKVIFAYWDVKERKDMEEMHPGATKTLRPTWLDVLKNKDGETGRLAYWMRPAYFLFEEIARDYQGGFANKPDEEAPPRNEPESEHHQEIDGLTPGDFDHDNG